VRTWEEAQTRMSGFCVFLFTEKEKEAKKMVASLIIKSIFQKDIVEILKKRRYILYAFFSF